MNWLVKCEHFFFLGNECEHLPVEISRGSSNSFTWALSCFIRHVNAAGLGNQADQVSQQLQKAKPPKVLYSKVHLLSVRDFSLDPRNHEMNRAREENHEMRVPPIS